METNESILQTILTSKGNPRYQAFKELWNRAKTGNYFSNDVWNLLTTMFSSKRPDTVYIPLQILGTLGAHGDKRINNIINTFVSLMYHSSVVIAPHAARYLCYLIKKQLNLEDKLLPLILNSEKKSLLKHKGILIAYTIEGLTTYYVTSKRKKEIFSFIQSHLNNKSPKARKFAKEFFKKYSN